MSPLREREDVNDQGFVLGESLGEANISARIAVFDELEPIGQGGTFADIGCGRGECSLELARRCSRILLVDVRPQNIDASRARMARLSATKAHYYCAAAELLPIADAVCDAVFLVEVLEHVREVPETLREIFRILKPSGRCYLSVPNRLFPFENHPVKFMGITVTPKLFPLLTWCPPLHNRMATARIFTPAEIRRIAAKTGFQPPKVGYVMPPFERSGLAFLRGFTGAWSRSPLRVFGVSIAAVLRKPDLTDHPAGRAERRFL